MFDAALLLAGLVAALVGAATADHGGPPHDEGPGPVSEMRTATPEEIAAAAAELPELLRRAEEAARRPEP